MPMNQKQFDKWHKSLTTGEPLFTEREIWIIQNWIREQLAINPDLDELSVIHKKLEELK